MVLFTLVLALAFLQPVKVSAYVLPKDLPTIEALIALHKAVKKDEDQALQRVATSFGEQSLLTKGAVKFNDVRTTLDTKLSNAHSYLVLAGAISSTANSLYQLVRDYKDFTSNTFSHVSKKPFDLGGVCAGVRRCNQLPALYKRIRRESEGIEN